MASSIKKGAIISYVAIFLNIAITFFYTPWMIRQIGVSDYGLYSLIMSFISYFIMDFGLHQAVQRFIAKYRAENNEDKVAKMVAITTKCYLAIDTVIFLVLLVLYFFISNIFTGLTPDEIERLKGLYVIAATFSILNFMFKPMAGAMMAFEYFVEERTLEMVNKVGIVLLVCLALYLGADVYALVLINGAVSLFVSVAKFIVFEKKSKLHIQWGYFDKSELKNVFSFSMWTFVVSLAQRLRITLVPAVLGVVSNSSEIAVFSLAMSIEGMIVTMSSAVNGLFLPKVSRLAHNGNRHQITELMIRVGRLQLYVWWLIISGFCVFGHVFLDLWVDEKFANSYYVVICIAAASLIAQTQTIAMDLVYAENKIKHTAKLTFISAIIGFAIAFPLAKIYGAVGAAIGSGLGLCLYQALLNIFYVRELHLGIGEYFANSHGKIVPLLSLYAIICIFVVRLASIDSWFALAVGIIAYAILFFLISYFFLFNNEEKSHLKFLKYKL